MTQSHGSSLPPRRLLLRHEGPKTAGLPTWLRTNQKEMDNVLLAEDPGFRSAADNASGVFLCNGPAALGSVFAADKFERGFVHGDVVLRDLHGYFAVLPLFLLQLHAVCKNIALAVWP